LNRRTWLTAVLVVAAAGFAIRFGMSFPWSRTIDILADADPLLLTAAGVVNIMSLAAKGTAWYLLLRRLAPVRLKTAQAATFVSAAVNSISVSVNGEFARAQVVRRDNVPLRAAATALVAVRLVEAIGLLLFLALAFVLISPWPGARAIGLAMVGVGAMLLLGSRWLQWSRREWERGGLGGAVGFATLNWLCQWVTYQWSIAATSVTVPPAASLAALVLANVAGILRLTPGNFGVTQGSMIVGLRPFSVPAADALAAGLALQAIQVLPVLLLGMVIAGRHGLRSLAARRSEALQ
jgi:uncharacterized membrane protein YbhN (UPF0104 family)